MKKNLTTLLLITTIQFALKAQNLIVNSGFETRYTLVANPTGYCHTPGTTNWADSTGADKWYAWINNPTHNSCMITELVNIKNTCCQLASVANSGVQGNIMHITSTIGHSGIAQNPLPLNKGVKVSCWVYVVRGGMTIGVLQNGAIGIEKSVASTTTCKWEQLSFTYDKPVNNLTIYSKWSATAGTDGAEFYIDNVIVEKL
ncbi:MAG: hypothetical protein IPP48_16365 [Chitinophagaceae bacterium]|nr:hypothetical protein [Chitinophagaceae bacterium]